MDKTPEFKKIEMMANGKLIDTFLINDKEVSESIYYTLLDDVSTRPIKEKKKVAKEKSNESNDLLEIEEAYIQDLLDDLIENPHEAFDMLHYELTFNFKMGYLRGQADINQAYYKAMKDNYRAVQNQIEDLFEE